MFEKAHAVKHAIAERLKKKRKTEGGPAETGSGVGGSEGASGAATATEAQPAPASTAADTP
eukprot:9487748-Pyramimonas_sp.AAC.1